MKKVVSILILCFSTMLSISSQQTYLQTSKFPTLPTNTTHFGKLTLGTTNHQGNFTIYEDGIPYFTLKNDHGNFQIGMANGLYNFHPTSKAGTVVLRNLGVSHNMVLTMPSSANNGLENIRIVDDINTDTFVVHNNGKVTIGTENFDTTDYKLYVKQGIKTEKIKVEFADVNGWADYVFADDYKLMSLRDVERFIFKNKHLPEIPSAEEVVENGVELKEMNVLLLKKIEELTLHMIEMQKKIEVLENKLAIEK